MAQCLLEVKIKFCTETCVHFKHPRLLRQYDTLTLLSMSTRHHNRISWAKNEGLDKKKDIYHIAHVVLVSVIMQMYCL